MSVKHVYLSRKQLSHYHCKAQQMCKIYYCSLNEETAQWLYYQVIHWWEKKVI